MRLLVLALLLLTGCCQVDALPRQAEPVEVQTPEMVRLLEEGDLQAIATTHDQTIRIRMKDGRRYFGTYVHGEAGRYASDPHLFDIYNLTQHIYRVREQRGERDRLWTEQAAE